MYHNRNGAALAANFQILTCRARESHADVHAHRKTNKLVQPSSQVEPDSLSCFKAGDILMT